MGVVRLRHEKNSSWTIEAESDGPHEPPLRINFCGENGYALAIAFLLSVSQRLREPVGDSAPAEAAAG